MKKIQKIIAFLIMVNLQATPAVFAQSHEIPSFESNIQKFKSYEEIKNDTKIVKLPLGTPINVKLVESISSSQLVKGQTVNFSIINDVKKDNIILFKTFTPITATVKEIKHKKITGIPGKIILSDFKLVAHNGSSIPLQNDIKVFGYDRTFITRAMGLFIIPLFVTGGSAKLYKNSDYVVQTSVDIEIAVK